MGEYLVVKQLDCSYEKTRYNFRRYIYLSYFKFCRSDTVLDLTIHFHQVYSLQTHDTALLLLAHGSLLPKTSIIRSKITPEYLPSHLPRELSHGGLFKGYKEKQSGGRTYRIKWLTLFWPQVSHKCVMV